MWLLMVVVAVVQVPILVARYAGQPELASKVEEAVRVHQDNDASVAAAVAISKVGRMQCQRVVMAVADRLVVLQVLEKVVLGSSIKDAFDSVQAQGQSAPHVSDSPSRVPP